MKKKIIIALSILIILPILASSIYYFTPKMDKDKLIEYVSNKYNIKPLKVTGHSTFKNALYSSYSMEAYINETEKIYVGETYIWGIIKIETRKNTYTADKPYEIVKPIKLESLQPIQVDSKNGLYIPKKLSESYRKLPKEQPNLNSPEEAFLKFTLLVQANKIEDAKKLFSKDLEDYRKKDLLTSGTSELVKLSYKLSKIENEKFYIKYSKRWKEGSSSSGSIPLIIEDAKWVLSKK